MSLSFCTYSNVVPCIIFLKVMLMLYLQHRGDCWVVYCWKTRHDDSGFWIRRSRYIRSQWCYVIQRVAFECITATQQVGLLDWGGHCPVFSGLKCTSWSLLKNWRYFNLCAWISIHICVTLQHVPIVEDFLNDLKESVKTVSSLLMWNPSYEWIIYYVTMD